MTTTKENETGREMIERLKRERPGVSISVLWEVDDYYTWDGDGPDPIEDGLFPHTVQVTAAAIIDGVMITREAYLGGCYSEWGGPRCPEVHGYLPQMIEEALEELDKALAL